MTPTKKKTTTNTKTPSSGLVVGAPLELDVAKSKHFFIVHTSIDDKDQPQGKQWLYGVVNRHTGHLEVFWNQLSAAILTMQTMDQTLSRVLAGEVTGYFVPGEQPKSSAIVS